MISEPKFPANFVQLITTIVNHERQVDIAKAQINLSMTNQLFKTIDHLRCGEIFVEDLYAYLKRKGLVLTKKDIKFVNKYFRFSIHQKLNMDQFKAIFLQVRNPTLANTNKQGDSQSAFFYMIKLALKKYYEIQEIRQRVVGNFDELRTCFKTYYPQNPDIITRNVLCQILGCLQMYSRLNFHFLCDYLIGVQPTEVSLSQIFWKDTEFNNFAGLQSDNASRGVKTSLKLCSVNSCKKVIKNIDRSLDIVAQIENIEPAIKKEQIKPEEQALKSPKKIAGLIPKFTQSRFSQITLSKVSERASKQSNTASSEFGWLNKKSDQKQIDEIRVSHSKEQVLSRASSSAKLKIQEIERKVLSKRKFNHSSHLGLLPSTASPHSNQSRSKFFSLMRR